jgi:two-component sensor histidine kinase
MGEDLINEFLNSSDIKLSWKTFQRTKLSEKQKQDLTNIDNELYESSVKYAKLLALRTELFVKIKKVEEDIKKTKVKHDNLIYPECCICGSPSYATYCSEEGCW